MADKIDELTAAEAAEAEDLSGLSLELLADDTGRPKFRLMAALAFVSKRRDEPGLKWGEFLKTTTSAEVYAHIYGGDDEEAEKQPADPFRAGPTAEPEGGEGAGEGVVLPQPADPAV